MTKKPMGQVIQIDAVKVVGPLLATIEGLAAHIMPRGFLAACGRIGLPNLFLAYSTTPAARRDCDIKVVPA